MPLYHYRAVNSHGQYQTGDWFGSSQMHLYQHLKHQKLQLLTYQTTKRTNSYPFFPKRIQLDDLIELCLHLHQMDEVKIPLSEAILLFAGSYHGRYFKSVLLTVYDSLQRGFLLSEAFRLHPLIFDMIFIETMALAEKTGEFGTAFKSLEAYLLEKKTFQQQLKQALRYPLILLMGLLLLLGLMGGMLLPQIQSQLQHVEAPSSSLASKSLIYMISLLNDYGIYLLTGLTLSFLGSFVLYRFSGTFQEFFDHIFLRIPFIGFFKRKVLFNKFARTFSLLLNARIDLLSSLEKAINSVHNKALQNDLYKVQADVRAGLKLSQSLQKYDFTSPVLQRYIQLGEETGGLGPLIQKAADFETKQINHYLQVLLAWAEPVLIIMIGGLLIWIVMATIIPLYDSLSIFEG